MPSGKELCRGSPFCLFFGMGKETNLPGYCGAAAGHPLHGPYHDREYGFPLRDDNGLFQRPVLEIAGEFPISTGYLPGAHVPECTVHRRTVDARPPWITASLGEDT